MSLATPAWLTTSDEIAGHYARATQAQGIPC
jgi:hypothetical protein